MTGLTPVPFRTGRGQQPRLSAPRDKNAPPHPRYWTEAENAVLREHYPQGGAQACFMKLPHRGMTRIYQHAAELGLRYLGPEGSRKARQRIDPPADIDDRLRAEWPALKGRGAVVALADRLQLPRWWVSKRARNLGLVQPHRKEPRWTAAEETLLTKVPLHDPDRAARIFREYGFRRTPTSIMVKAARLSLSRRYTETLSARQAAKILGVDDTTITGICLSGDLRAGRRGTRRLTQQGGDVWAIEPADLRRYVIDHLERVDFRKVDKFALVEILVAPQAAP